MLAGAEASDEAECHSDVFGQPYSISYVFVTVPKRRLTPWKKTMLQVIDSECDVRQAVYISQHTGGLHSTTHFTSIPPGRAPRKGKYSRGEPS